jgi:LysR family hydrogen peroxide-inducible transcriptional activator
MANLTLRQLRYFAALARHGHFGRAAAACAVSQPALSVQIREMESALGAPLFERAPRQLRLTGFGAAVAERVDGILSAVAELGDLARVARGGLAGRLRIGVIPTIAPYFLPAILEALGRSDPGLDIDVRETLTSRLLGDLAAGRIDTAILALPISEPGLTETPLFREDFVLVRPAAEASEPVPDAEALRSRRLLLLEEGHCFRNQALAFCRIGPNAQPGLDAASLSTLVQMVAAGLGVTLIPEMAVPVETRSAAVCIARLAAPAPSRAVGLVWRAASPLAGELDRIAGVLRAASSALRATSAAADRDVACRAAERERPSR